MIRLSSAFLVIASILSFHVEAKLLELPTGFIEIAKECNSNPKALYAIALNETETTLTNGIPSVWPHSINHQGTPYRFADRISMYDFANNLIANGYKSFDIGLMQVNWRWHKQRVTSLWELTDVVTNVRVACEILNEGFDIHGDWVAAAGYYHAPYHQQNAMNYKKGFRQKLNRIGD